MLFQKYFGKKPYEKLRFRLLIRTVSINPNIKIEFLISESFEAIQVLYLELNSLNRIIISVIL